MEKLALMDVRSTPADQRYQRYHAREKTGAPTWVCACLAVNSCMGSGFLALPLTFARAGILLSSCTVVVMTCLMSLTTSWEAEAMFRAEALVGRRLGFESNSFSSRTFEVTELCSLFGGKLHVVYSLVFLIYLLCTSWAYAFVFAEALATQAPMAGYEACTADDPCELYKIYCLIFLCLAVPLSLLEPTEQASFQIFMSAVRVVVAAAMTLTSFGSFDNPQPAHPKALGPLLPAAIFALNINGNVPLIAKAMRHKEQIDIAVRVGLWLPCLLYILIGSSVAWNFGTRLPRSANVQWENYNGNYFLAKLIVLFPAADVLSVFPLNTIVIANNLLVICYGDKVDKAQHSNPRFFRLLVAIPPILGAAFLANFTTIISYTGVLAIAISCIFPPLLSILGRDACRREFGDDRFDVTRYSLDYAYVAPKVIVVLCGLLCISLAIYL